MKKDRRCTNSDGPDGQPDLKEESDENQS